MGSKVAMTSSVAPSSSPPARAPACAPSGPSRCTGCAAGRWCSRARRAGRAATSTGRRGRRPRRRAGHQEAPARTARPGCHRVRRAARAARHRRRRRAWPHRLPRRRLDDDDDADILVLPGDTPLLRPPTLAALVDAPPRQPARRHRAHRPAAPTRPATAGSCAARTTGSSRIVEQRDATDEELAIDEINTSIYCFRRSLLAPALRRLTPDNAQGEYYLTDVVEVLRRGRPPGRARSSPTTRSRRSASTTGPSWPPPRPSCAGRINAALDAPGRHHARPRRAPTSTPPSQLGARRHALPRHDPAGPRPSIGDGAEIGPDTRLVDCVVGAGLRGRARPSAGDAEIGAGAVVGPVRRPRSPAASVPPTAPRPGRSTLPLGPERRRGARTVPWRLVTKRTLQLYSGRSHPAAGRGHRRAPRRRAGRGEPRRLRQRRDALPLRRVDPRRRRLHHPDPRGRAVGQRRDHGAADHDRRRQAGLGQAHHRGAAPTTATPARTARPRAASRSRAKLVADMLTAAGADRLVSRRPALRPDPGLLRRPGRPPHRHARAARLPRASTAADDLVDRVARRRPGEGGRALRPAPQRRPRLRPQAPAEGHDEPGRGARRHRRRRAAAAAC